MDVHDAHGLALLVIGRRDEEREVQPDARCSSAARAPRTTAAAAPKAA